MLYHRVHTVAATGGTGVHLALADDLAIGGLEHEVVFVVAGGFDLEGALELGVTAD